MKSFLCAGLAASLVTILACGGDDTGATTSATTGGGTTTGTGSGGGMGGGTGSSTTSTGTAGAGGGAATTAGAGGGGPDCSSLPAGPIEPVLVHDVLGGSEDIAFDGKGHIAGKDGGQVVLVDAQGQTTNLADLAGTVYGLRYLGDGNLLAALPQQGKLVQITPAGAVSDYATGLGTPNGIFPDFDGNVWVTEFGANKVTRINPDKTEVVIATGGDASAPNGVVLDPTKTMLFYTEYQEGNVWRVDVDDPNAMPVQIATINGALDGMVMDACGNLYVVDQGGSRLYRIALDATGAAIGQPELLADFPQNVANAQFGSGAGYDASTLYVAGNPGAVYAVPAGVPGAAVPTAP